MIELENTKEIVTFEYEGKTYQMSQDEIEAAYRYQESQYRKADALTQLNYFVFGYDEPYFGDNPDDASGGEAEDLAYFEEQYGVSYSVAKEFVDGFEAEFYAIFDCNIPENELWHTAIENVLKEVKGFVNK